MAAVNYMNLAYIIIPLIKLYLKMCLIYIFHIFTSLEIKDIVKNTSFHEPFESPGMESLKNINPQENSSPQLYDRHQPH